MTYLETGADLSSNAEPDEPNSGTAARIATGSFVCDNRATSRGYTIEHGLGAEQISISLRVAVSGAVEDAHCDWDPVDEDGASSDDKLTFFPSERHASSVRFDWIAIG